MQLESVALVRGEGAAFVVVGGAEEGCALDVQVCVSVCVCLCVDRLGERGRERGGSTVRAHSSGPEVERGRWLYFGWGGGLGWVDILRGGGWWGGSEDEGWGCLGNILRGMGLGIARAIK